MMVTPSIYTIYNEDIYQIIDSSNPNFFKIISNEKKNYLTPKFLMFDISMECMQNDKSIKHKEFFGIPDILIYNYLNYTCFAIIIIHRRK